MYMYGIDIYLPLFCSIHSTKFVTLNVNLCAEERQNLLSAANVSRKYSTVCIHHTNNAQFSNWKGIFFPHKNQQKCQIICFHLFVTQFTRLHILSCLQRSWQFKQQKDSICLRAQKSVIVHFECVAVFALGLISCSDRHLSAKDKCSLFNLPLEDPSTTCIVLPRTNQTQGTLDLTGAERVKIHIYSSLLFHKQRVCERVRHEDRMWLYWTWMEQAYTRANLGSILSPSCHWAKNYLGSPSCWWQSPVMTKWKQTRGGQISQMLWTHAIVIEWHKMHENHWFFKTWQKIK